MLLQVGNSMNLFRTSNGAAIDRHKAVMRFNNEWERMQHVMREAGTLRPDTQAQHLGFKTTFRLLNRKYTNQVRMNQVERPLARMELLSNSRASGVSA